MVKVQLSNDFERAHAQHAHQLDDAKKAENQMRGLPVPPGTAGQALLLNIESGRSKEKKDDKGNITGGGNPYVNFVLGIQTPDDAKGKKMTKNWAFYDSENASYEDRYQWFLNDLENAGLPREIREKHDTIGELFQWFADQEDLLINYEVVQNGRFINLNFQSNDQAAAAQQLSEKANRQVEVGQEVKFLGSPNKIVEILENKQVKIENAQGKQKDVAIEDLEIDS